MRKIRNTAIITILAFALVGLSGCTTLNNFKEAFIDKPQDKEATIQIGVFEPLSGADADSAKDEIKGIELANSVHPNVNGQIIELVYSDNKSDMNVAETAIQTLIVREPKAIIGSYGSLYSLAASDTINEAEIPAITPSNTNPLVTKNNDYYYRVCFVDANQGDILARYVLEQTDENEAGILLPEGDDVALAMATAFANRMKSETDNSDAIKVYEEYTPGAEDFSSQIKAIKKSGVKYVLLPGENKDSANIINQAESEGLDVVFLGDRDWNDEEFLESLGDDVNSENMAVVQYFATDASVTAGATEEREAFLEAYKEEYGNEEPSDAVALGYDAYMVAVDAIDRAGEGATGKEINAVLQDPMYEFTGASGTINFDNMGDPIKTTFVCTWDGNSISTICTMLPLE